MIRFEFDQTEVKPHFKDVPITGFFVSSEGLLCQKVSDRSCNIIANSLGEPYAKNCEVVENFEISRIIPTPVKICF